MAARWLLYVPVAPALTLLDLDCVITAGGNSGRRWFHHTFVFATGWRAVDTELGVSARHLWMGPGIMLIGAAAVEDSRYAVLMLNRFGKMCIESAASQ